MRSAPTGARAAPRRSGADRADGREVHNPVQITELSSGLRVVTEPMPDVHSVAIGFWVGSGSRDESDAMSGASHFLEHLLFKGSARRTATDIAEAVDGVGGDCNAFTTKEYTTFYIRLLAEHLALGLDILGDIMVEPALRPPDVESERTVILDEILMHADEPTELVAERWLAAVFPGHSLGRDALGTAQSVQDLSTTDIRGFFDTHYRPSNMVLAVAGNCRHEEVVAEAERQFPTARSGQRQERHPPAGQQQALALVRRDTEQVHLMLGTRSCSRFDDRRWSAALLNHVLGGGLSSRLFRKIREERGLAYSVGSERAAYADAGTLAVVAGTAPEHVDEVLQIALEELDDLASAGATERELDIAKSNLRADLLLSAEDSGARMSRIGAALLLHDRVLSLDELLGHIDAVSAEDVRAMAAATASAPRTLAVVGPVDDTETAWGSWVRSAPTPA